jgi:hypothetical protein
MRTVFAIVASAWMACATTAPPGPAPTSPPSAAPGPVSEAPVPGPSGLRIKVDPPDAEIFVDGTSLGPANALASAGTIPMAPGLYQVSLKRSGYQTWRAEVSVKDSAQPIEVTLVRVPRQ